MWLIGSRQSDIYKALPASVAARANLPSGHAKFLFTGRHADFHFDHQRVLIWKIIISREHIRRQRTGKAGDQESLPSPTRMIRGLSPIGTEERCLGKYLRLLVIDNQERLEVVAAGRRCLLLTLRYINNMTSQSVDR